MIRPAHAGLWDAHRLTPVKELPPMLQVVPLSLTLLLTALWSVVVTLGFEARGSTELHVLGALALAASILKLSALLASLVSSLLAPWWLNYPHAPHYLQLRLGCTIDYDARVAFPLLLLFVGVWLALWPLNDIPAVFPADNGARFEVTRTSLSSLPLGLRVALDGRLDFLILNLMCNTILTVCAANVALHLCERGRWEGARHAFVPVDSLGKTAVSFCASDKAPDSSRL
jgi:hypothetical protein